MTENAESLLDFFRAFAEIVSGVPEEDQVSRDRDDDFVLACAVDGKVDYILSGDPHLLDLKSYKKIPDSAGFCGWAIPFDRVSTNSTTSSGRVFTNKRMKMPQFEYSCSIRGWFATKPQIPLEPGKFQSFHRVNLPNRC